MNKVLYKFINKFIIIYLNNILIYSKILEDYKRYIRLVLIALSKVYIILNLEKYIFFIIEIRFLRYIISINSSHLDLRNIEKILN
jgi:hypothetical protein